MWLGFGLLYGYKIAPGCKEILYVDNADGALSTVRSRWNAEDTTGFFRNLKRQRGVYRHAVVVKALAWIFHE